MPIRLTGERANTAPPTSNPYEVHEFPAKRNIILYGDTGAGKSSIINMLDSESLRLATVSNQTHGVTFKSEAYEKYLPGRTRSGPEVLASIYDTAGLNEADAGTVSPKQAIANLWELLGQLKDRGGLHLVVFVVRGPRLTATTVKNYKLLRLLVGAAMHVALVVTGLENEGSNLDEWWRKNRQQFDVSKMSFTGHACITATRGRLLNEETGECVYDEPYEASVPKVEDLLLDTASTVPFIVEQEAWLKRTFVEICNFFGLRVIKEREELCQLLVDYGIDKKEARKLTEKVKLTQTRKTLPLGSLV